MATTHAQNLVKAADRLDDLAHTLENLQKRLHRAANWADDERDGGDECDRLLVENVKELRENIENEISRFEEALEKVAPGRVPTNA